ncbi:SSTR2 [Branchiostoma lanceolatum]|uniref:SSTR2 protein n=1 Tax=Branchiostoma lanceolatum TaxID=7740 RepID=A0A8J9W2X7_BRALA|nr:SSTR2 [Branchiostoma lanceolatum]
MSASNASSYFSAGEKALRNVLTALGSTFTVVGLAGNLLVIFIILRFPRMRTVSNVYLFSIAFSDLNLLMVAPIVIQFYRYGQWTFGPGSCEAESCIKFTSMFASFFLVSAFNFQRYKAIANPIETRQRQSLKRAALICLSLFILALVANLPFCVTSFVVDHELDNRNVTVCRYFWPDWSNISEHAERAHRLYLTCLGFLLPLCLNFTLYVLIVRKLHSQDAFRSAVAGKHLKDSTTVTKMAVMVTASFVICVGPFHMYNFISAVSDIHMSEYVGMWTCVLTFGNSALDPIIYALMGTNFQECMKQLFCRRPLPRHASETQKQLNDSDVLHENIVSP